MPASTFRVGTSNQKGFTPQAQNLPASDVSRLIPCVLLGDLIRSTDIFVRPGRLRYQIQKYEKLGQTLKYPADYDLASEPDLPVGTAPVAVVVKPRRTGERPVVCLNTGRFFDSVRQISRTYGFSAPNASAALRGLSNFVKGRSIRYATPEEIAMHDSGIWQYQGELIPIKGKQE